MHHQMNCTLYCNKRTAMNMKLLVALDWAADAIKRDDGGDMTTETGWASDEALEHWLTIRSLIETQGGAAARGGPTVNDPSAPYCKPDQSCCDFTCGN